MGKALRDGYRQKVFLMTKIDGRSYSEAMRQLELYHHRAALSGSMNQNAGAPGGNALIPYEPNPVTTINPMTVFCKPSPARASTLMVSPFCKSENEMGYKSHDAELPGRSRAIIASTKGDALNIASRRVWTTSEFPDPAPYPGHAPVVPTRVGVNRSSKL